VEDPERTNESIFKRFLPVDSFFSGLSQYYSLAPIKPINTGAKETSLTQPSERLKVKVEGKCGNRSLLKG